MEWRGRGAGRSLSVATLTLAALSLALMISGCAPLRLPAIDPSGDHVFLPCNQSTSLNTGFGSCLSRLPRPAFKRPEPAPPASVLGGPVGGPPLDLPPAAQPCNPTAVDPQAPCAVSRRLHDQSLGVLLHQKVAHHLHKLGHHDPVVPRGTPGELCLTPTRLVAPVGTDVILAAGLCGEDGHLVTKQPIEWMLSQDSVGQIIEVGEPASSHATWRLHSRPREGCKLGVNYAINTSTIRDQILTRGTPSQRDDLRLLSGQAWISVSSPSEGETYVTSLVPDGDNWDQRRRTATIHWVDAKWAFPDPVALRVGQRHELVTTVVRASDGLPVEDWIVKYELVSGPSLAFVQSGGPVAEVRTDPQGLARVLVDASTTQTGVSVVKIDVVRPPRGAEPRLKVGDGQVSLQWTAPALALRCQGPATVAVGGVASYQLTLTNPGNLPADNVRLTVELPAGFETLNAAPVPTQQFPERLLWEVERLAGGQTFVAVINCRATRDGDVRIQSLAEGDGGLSASDSCATQVARPSLDVSMERVDLPAGAAGDAAELAEVGQLVTYGITVRNTGTAPLSNVTIREVFPPQLQQRLGLTSPIERLISADAQQPGVLLPGQEANIELQFQVLAPGRHCHQLTATAAGGQQAFVERCIQAAPAERRIVPRLEIHKQGPPTAIVGRTVQYVIEVTNSGDAPLINVNVADQYPPSLRPVQATAGNRSLPGDLRWILPRLEPNQTQRFEVVCECVAPDPAAVNRGVVTAQVYGTNVDVPAEVAEVTTRIVAAEAPAGAGALGPGPAAPAAPVGPAAPPPAAAGPAPVGNLRVSVTALANPVAVGQPVEYVVVIHNDRNVPDQSVGLQLTLPQGFELVQPVRGPSGLRSQQAGLLTFQPIVELRAGESLQQNPYRITLRPTQNAPPQARVVAQVISLLSPNGVVAETVTSVQ